MTVLSLPSMRTAPVPRLAAQISPLRAGSTATMRSRRSWFTVVTVEPSRRHTSPLNEPPHNVPSLASPNADAGEVSRAIVVRALPRNATMLPSLRLTTTEPSRRANIACTPASGIVVFPRTIASFVAAQTSPFAAIRQLRRMRTVSRRTKRIRSPGLYASSGFLRNDESRIGADPQMMRRVLDDLPHGEIGEAVADAVVLHRVAVVARDAGGEEAEPDVSEMILDDLLDACG